jgi:hypothetical protein
MQRKAAGMTHAHEDTMASHWVYIFIGFILF